MTKTKTDQPPSGKLDRANPRGLEDSLYLSLSWVHNHAESFLTLIDRTDTAMHNTWLYFHYYGHHDNQEAINREKALEVLPFRQFAEAAGNFSPRGPVHQARLTLGSLTQGGLRARWQEDADLLMDWMEGENKDTRWQALSNRLLNSWLPAWLLEKQLTGPVSYTDDAVRALLKEVFYDALALDTGSDRAAFLQRHPTPAAFASHLGQKIRDRLQAMQELPKTIYDQTPIPPELKQIVRLMNLQLDTLENLPHVNADTPVEETQSVQTRTQHIFYVALETAHKFLPGRDAANIVAKVATGMEAQLDQEPEKLRQFAQAVFDLLHIMGRLEEMQEDPALEQLRLMSAHHRASPEGRMRTLNALTEYPDTLIIDDASRQTHITAAQK